MIAAHELLRSVREQAGQTQAALAQRLGSSQAAIAQLEHPHANPTVGRLRRVLEATGNDLVLSVEPRRPHVDENQLARHLAMTPAQRLAAFAAGYRNVRGLLQAVRPPV